MIVGLPAFLSRAEPQCPYLRTGQNYADTITAHMNEGPEEASLTRRQVLALAATTVLSAAGCASTTPGSRSPGGSPLPRPESADPPIIYSTDLSHPHVDPDDHFDLAVAHGLGLDVQTVILDQHLAIGAVPGMAPITQLNALTGRRWPASDGLPKPLRSLSDRGDDQAGDRDAVTAVLNALRHSKASVIIVGSCRDIAAAYNSDPGLFHERIERLVIFAGEASLPGAVEYNVGLDPLAFVRLMGSGLPIRWVPCFDGGPWQAGRHASFVQVPQALLLPSDLPPPLIRYFVYMARRETSDPIEFLDRPITTDDWQLLHSGQRNLWGGPLLATGDGDGEVRFDGKIVGLFEPVTARFNAAGAVDETGSVAASVERWRVLDRPAWERAMVAGVVTALRQIPIIAAFR